MKGIIDINNIQYISPSDVVEVAGVNYNSLRVFMNRGSWKNIANPYYNGRNSKRLILISSIPQPYQEVILASFSKDVKNFTEKLYKIKDSEDIAILSSKAVAEVVGNTSPLVREEVISWVDSRWNNYTAPYINAGLPSESVIRYARTCALVAKVYTDINNLSTENNTYSRARTIRNSYKLLLIELAQDKNLNAYLPKSDRRVAIWLDDILDGLMEGKKEQDLVPIKNEGNSNASKFTEEQKKIALSLRAIGKAHSITYIYNQLIELAKQKKWWHKADKFCPISMSSLCSFYRENDNLASKSRQGNLPFINTIVPTVLREYPQHKNALWSIDGSPIDELVFNPKSGRASQSANAIRVYDSGTFKFIGVCIYSGKGEGDEQTIHALNDAVLRTGYLPKAVQSDHGPAHKAIEEWCKLHNVIFMPAGVGLARAKISELLIGRFGQILKNRSAWSGQNRTALGRNSHLSKEAYDDAQRNATTFDNLKYWLENEGIDAWNNLVIHTMAGKTCQKTPNQLWEEKPSFTPELSEVELSTKFGHYHRVRLTIDGLTIQNENTSYTYFPNIWTEQGFKQGLDVYTRIPLKHHPESGKLSIYLLKYGEKAFVYDKNIEDRGKLLGVWVIKPAVPMVASLYGGGETLSIYQKFQKAIKGLAQEITEDAKETRRVYELEDFCEKNSQRTITSIYEKEVVQTRESMDEEQIQELHSNNKIEFVDSYTGEIIKL